MLVEVPWEILALIWTCVVAGGTWILAQNWITPEVIQNLLEDLHNDGFIRVVEHPDGQVEVKKITD